MIDVRSHQLIRNRYLTVHGAAPPQCFSDSMDVVRGEVATAVLGYRRASEAPLFLESYLDEPINQCLTRLFGRPVERDQVIELGSLAASDAFGMITLWAKAANDLGDACEIAVATLTAPLRQMFARMSVPIHVLAPASLDRVEQPHAWGRYYDSDPMVCAGLIAEGQRAIATYLSPRAGRSA